MYQIGYSVGMIVQGIDMWEIQPVDDIGKQFQTVYVPVNRAVHAPVWDIQHGQFNLSSRFLISYKLYGKLEIRNVFIILKKRFC